MTAELVLLHALPLDTSMWAGQCNLLPGATCAPTLYGLGDSVEAWADAVLRMTKGDRLVVVGCSVGGSCALEIAAAAPDRVAALVLIGTKARHRPDPALHAAALRTLNDGGVEAAWSVFWAPQFSPSAPAAREAAKRIALRQNVNDLARGVGAFHRRPSRDGILSRFPRPVAVVTGAEDRAPGQGVSAAQAASAPHGQLHVIADCGHYVPLEKPASLNAILRDVIAALHAPPRRRR